MPDLTRVVSVDEIEPLFAQSEKTPVFIFKHSLTCGISQAAFAEYQRFAQQPAGAALCALIEIQNARDVSNAIAARTGIRHESPQAILLRDGQAVWHASHWSIRAGSLAQALEN